jgi:hypothetical protein
MVSYTLSWEEYMEMYNFSLPQQVSASFLTTVWAAIFSAAAALLVPDSIASVSLRLGLFCISLALFLVAVWNYEVATPRRREQIEHGLRSFYESYFSGERVFTFDGERWTLRTQSGHQEGIWAGLRSATESRSTFALCAENQLVLVPKRALTGEEVDLMRRLALSTGNDMNSFQVGLFDYVLTEIPSFWWRNHLSPAQWLGATVFLLVASKAIAGDGLGFIWLSMGMALCVGAAIFCVQLFYVIFKYFTNRGMGVVSWAGEFSDRGARAKTSYGDVFFAWTEFDRFRETRRCFLLYYASQKYYLLAKKCLSKNQQSALRQLLTEKLTARRQETT